jgi:hypothetical protein
VKARKEPFQSVREARAYYRDNANRIDRSDRYIGPDDSTVRRANKRYNLDQYVTIKAPDKA